MIRKFDDFIHLYSLSKTLRFEARPIGETLHHFINNGLLERDEHRAESYVKVKKLIDEYHKAFIDRVLNDGALNYEDKGECDSLTEYYALYSTQKRDEATQKHFKETQQHLRNQLVKKLTDGDAYKHLFGKELIESYKDKENKNKLIEADLVQFINAANPEQLLSLSKNEAKDLVQEFCGFTTYFGGFHQNRQNMYSAEEKSTGIAYRLINENLPKFIDNMESFKKIAAIPEMEDNLKQLYANFAEYLNVENIHEMFQLDYYNLLLTQKQIDVYNAIIGGKTDNEHKEKIKGINEYVNLYNQTHKDAKLPKLKVLFKQILSDRNAISWLPEEFKDDQEALNAIKDCYARLSENVLGDKILKELLCSLAAYDTKGIFLRNDLQLTDISQKMLGNWSVIPNAIKNDIKDVTPAKKRKESEEDYEKRIDNLFKKQDSFSIDYIDACLDKFVDNNTHTIEGYFATLGAVDTQTTQLENIFAQIKNAYTGIESLLNSAYPEDKNLSQDKDNVAKIKLFLDALMSLMHFVKPLLGKGDESNKDEKFYGDFTLLWTELETVVPLYNTVRNYMTRKPYSNSKIKLNFDNSRLLGGWDANKEKDYASILLRRDGKYYLAIMDKDSKKLLGKSMPSDGECYEKMVYKLLPGANKMLPKVFFAKSRIEDFKPSEQLLENYSKDTHKKGKNFSISDCHALIDYFKQSINKHEDWKNFDFNFSETSTYEDLSGFYREVEQQGYKITFTKISVSFIDKLVEKGKMYLFQIYNKDFSEYSKGTPNMHTLYWKALFDDRNLKDVVYKLNGQGEMFFRKKSINCNHPTHPANQPIQNKNKDNKKKESVFEYDLIKDRRYTIDKFIFHVPVTMNFKSTGTENINLPVREYLQTSNDTHIIGIDRGERHLLYLVVIDPQGNIVEQYTLNDIVNEHNGNTYRTNYHDLLNAREAERLKARQSWQTIENIKELKEGYLSQVIHKITQLMIKYHAIVVLEDLNKGFMRGRQKVEKQVYQKFEKMLIDKLNYLVDKKTDIETTGGLLNAYQLTSKFESFQKLGKQSGFLFYIPAWNTSKIDPVTGFVNLLDTRYHNVDKSKAFFAKFDSIRYNKEKDWFEFALDYDNFGNKAEGTRTKWILCTQGKRIKTFRNAEKNSQWDDQEIDLTIEFKQLFAHYDIDINGNLKDAISNQTEKTFFVELMRLLKLTLQMRNSITGKETDYLVSPVADENGNFYDSCTCDASLPKNADANGAFNIARKGLMLIEQIKATDDLSKLKFDISNKSWLNFAQQKPYKNE
ncbi:MAG: type V CRISPR-associated protein Cas12a/Cpf1 [Prevotella sp.]|nr:type V CRISPR-associated protein Cas12a/Cpf1 [Prevotellaceae bacterium]MDY3935842.1 type V CRISPR-associated protein Cas12a/Cpf1 [Prevotella sp.]